MVVQVLYLMTMKKKTLRALPPPHRTRTWMCLPSSPLLRLSVRPPTTYLLRSIKRDEAMQPARTRSKEGGSQPAREVNVDNKDTKKSDFKESLTSFLSLSRVGPHVFLFLRHITICHSSSSSQPTELPSVASVRQKLCCPAAFEMQKFSGIFS